MARQINSKRFNIKGLDNLKQDFGREVSIKVGIIGSRAGQKVGGNDKKTIAELGAVHEFGTTINVNKEMRNYLNSQGIHLQKDTTTVEIPASSFLRTPLMSREGIKELTNVVIGHTDVGTGGKKKLLDCVTPCAFENKIMDNTAHLVAEAAYSQVLKALEENGSRATGRDVISLTDAGTGGEDGSDSDCRKPTRSNECWRRWYKNGSNRRDLRKSISYEIKCKNYAKT